MRLPIFAGMLLATFALLNTACKKPTQFGSDLLEGEYADYDFTDTITVECTLLRLDSLISSDRTGAAPHFLCGELNDPVYGKSSSDIYSLMIAESLNPQFNPDSITFDSIVMYLNYAPAGVYGDTLQAQTLRVHRLSGSLRNDSTYYSNSSIEAAEEIGRIDNFYPKPHKSDSLFEGYKGAFLRVRLDDNLGRELLALDSLSWQADSSFFRKLRGFKISCSANGANPGAMLAFNMNNQNLSRVALYYTGKSDTAQSRFDFFFRNANKFTRFQHDYAGSEIAGKIGTQLDDRMYVQGMDGVQMKITFPYANNLDQIAVNKAQLVLTVDDDKLQLPTADQLVFTELTGDTIYNFTSDVLQALSASSSVSLKTFGGFPEKEFVNGDLKTRYRLSLGEKFQHIINDDAAPNIKNRTIYLSVYPRVRSAQRAVLYGPDKNNPNNPFRAKLELKYTRVR